MVVCWAGMTIYVDDYFHVVISRFMSEFFEVMYNNLDSSMT